MKSTTYCSAKGSIPRTMAATWKVETPTRKSPCNYLLHTAESRPQFKEGTFIESKTVRYMIRSKIGESNYGVVLAVENEHGNRLAVKVEWRDPNEVEPKLSVEITILRTLRQRSFSPHFIDYIDRSSKPIFHMMVTSLVGPSLDRLAEEKLLSCCSALKVMQQAHEAIREVHKIGYIHRDLRPSCLCIGLHSKKNLIYLVNFGNAAIYQKGRKLREPRSVVPMKGHITYASLSSHNRKEQSPKDDYEMLLYTVVDLSNTLPWKSIKNSNEVRTHKEDVRTINRANFFNKLAVKALGQLLDYLDALSYFDTIDEDFIAKIINEAGNEIGEKNLKAALFDWEVDGTMRRDDAIAVPGDGTLGESVSSAETMDK
uniref:Protein kinase domain-containing protein n=1 Tax=Parascaris univalens TaxID=6257 RepID=A0A915AAJ2_PARUN